MKSTREVLKALREEGRKVDMNRIQRFVMEGDMDPPAVIGGSRIWSETEVDHLRSIIDRKDSARTSASIKKNDRVNNSK